MPDPLAEGVAPGPAAAPPRKRGVAWLAWVVILLVVGFEVFGLRLLQHLRPNLRRPAAPERADQPLIMLQVRSVVGLAELTGGGKALLPQARALNTGPVAQRLSFIVLVGDLEGPGEALDQIAALRTELAEQHIEPGPDQAAVLDALARLYEDRRDMTDTLTDADRDLLRRQLGWTGELALTPADPDHKEAR